MSYDDDPYWKYTPPPKPNETYEEKLERYKEGWRRELDDDLRNGR